ncbi:hypothetical protein HY628_02880 [Candidatus Uhrbacteria bacterium]|nr:hypothetical protein [Candidatus Uhrbacteria bacterium]
MKPIAIVLSIIFAFLFFGLTKSKNTKNQPKNIGSNNAQAAFDQHSIEIQKLERQLSIQRAALASVVRDHTEGQRLLAMFDEQSHPLLFQGNRGYNLSKRPQTEYSFSVTVLPDDQLRYLLGEFGRVFAAGYMAQIRTLFLNAQPMSDCWRGFLLAHEMTHVWHHVVDQYPPQPFNSDAYILEEIRAFEFEFGVIDRWTKGQFLKTIDQAAKETNDSLILTDAILQKIDSLFPRAVNQDESGLRHDVYQLAVILRNSKQQPIQNIRQEKIRRYRAFFAKL